MKIINAGDCLPSIDPPKQERHCAHRLAVMESKNKK